MSIHFKAYLLKENGTDIDEIRSFRVDEGAASSYEYLRKKIATVFPNLGWDEDGSALKLLWKDTAGDLVTFNSDEELVDALGEVGTEGIFKVYIKKIAEENDFSWQNYVEEMLKSIRVEPSCGRPQTGFPPFHPYARSRFRGGCRSRPGCCGGRPSQEFPFGPTQSPFPGLFAEIWAFQGNGNNTSSGGCCGQQQRKKEKEQQKDEACCSKSKDQEAASS